MELAGGTRKARIRAAIAASPHDVSFVGSSLLVAKENGFDIVLGIG